MTTALQWHGPLSWVTTAGIPCIFDKQCMVGAAPGVYIWAVPYREIHLAYYVGKTDQTLRRRLYTEYARFLDGREHLPNPVLLREGVKDFLYKPLDSRRANTDEFQRRQAELQPITGSLLHLFHLFAAPVPEGLLMKRLESAILQDIWDTGEPAWNILSNYSWPKPKRDIKVRMIFPKGIVISGLKSFLYV